MKRIILLLLPILLGCQAKEEVKNESPRLVMGIVIDQMRFDLLERFDTLFGEGGFKRLKKDGLIYKSCFFDYAQTLTGPGHASVFTGSPPSVHGIASNTWFDLNSMKSVYSALDEGAVVFSSTGNDSINGRSPKNLKVSTIGDQFKKAFGDSSKVLGISLKDRAAVLSSGKNANMALWMKDDGLWTTSNYYADKTPLWVENWNEKGALLKYQDSIWNPLLSEYPTTSNLEQPFERIFKGQTDSGFPKDFSKIVPVMGPTSLMYSPYGNTELLDFTLKAFEEYQLGKDDIPDFLSLSFSSTDKIGHAFGPYSEEIADTYLRLDKEIERLLNYLDREIGEGQYSLFLTADHGICNIPGRIDSVNNGGGHVFIKEYVDSLKLLLENEFSVSDLVSFYKDEQIWLNEDLIQQNELDQSELISFMSEYLEGKEGIRKIVKADGSNADGELDELILRGVYPGRSGQVYVLYEPGYVEHWGSGVDHGTPYKYDRHVPLIWYGRGIESGIIVEPIAITQIAPSLCKFLGIEIPSGSKGNFLEDLPYSE